MNVPRADGFNLLLFLPIPHFAQKRNLLRPITLKALLRKSNEELIKQPKVYELYRELIDSYNKFFNHVEQIKRFELLPQEWSIETGEMTPKLSLKRKVIMEKYRDAIERIYHETKQETA